MKTTKWSKMEGIKTILFTFPKGTKIAIKDPLWENSPGGGIKNYLTKTGRDYSINNSWLCMEFVGYNPSVTEDGMPDVELIDMEEGEGNE